MFGYHLYYDVPPCPNCGSEVTGRYIKYPFMNKGLAYEQSLIHGELVTEVDKVPYNNCYCESCGFEWHAYITSKLINSDELMEQKRKRGVIHRFEDFKDKYYVNGKRPKDSLFKRLFL